MNVLNFKRGVGLVEMMVMVGLMSIVLLAGSMVFVAGQNTFSLTYARSELLENSLRVLQRISIELQESGRDSAGNMKVSILDGTGVNGTDVLRFSVPLCLCGISPMDSNGNVSRWGAPLTWGQAGCSTNYPTDSNGKVDLCHYPPANPNNPHTMNLGAPSVKAHLAHGDYLGACGSCDPNTYTNRTIEYVMDNSGQLLRRVLDTNNAVVSSSIFAQHLTDFQASINGGQTEVTVAVKLSEIAVPRRTISISNSMDVMLRNRG